eukprot:scaffold64117_cov48-Phaeocystis_antarctica.AAC.1
MKDCRRAWPPDALGEGGVQGGPPYHGGCWTRGDPRPRSMPRCGLGGGSGGRRGGGGCVVRELGGPGEHWRPNWRRSVDRRRRRPRRSWRRPRLPFGWPNVPVGQRVVPERRPKPLQVGCSMLLWTLSEEVVLRRGARGEAHRRRGRREAGRGGQPAGRVGRR